jgi:thiosulfate reductase cytochrome b subunit
LLFFLVHIIMVCRAGVRNRMRAMITGRTSKYTERA